MKVAIDIPFCNPLDWKRSQLLDAVIRAHQVAAAENRNISSVTAINVAAGSGDVGNAVAAAILSTGIAHAPVMLGRWIYEDATRETILAAKRKGVKIPGFGNSFFKGEQDPAWLEVQDIIARDFPYVQERIAEITAWVNEDGKNLLPNAALLTGAVCAVCGFRPGTEMALFIMARTPIWVDRCSGGEDKSCKRHEAILIRVVGMPRSGTAFLSVMLSLHPECRGYHELASTNRDWRSEIENAKKTHRYVADCTTYGWMVDVPECINIHVTADSAPCAEACSKAFGWDVEAAGMEKVRLAAIDWAARNGAWVIQRENLFTIETLEKVWVYCFGHSFDFPKEKVEHLLLMHVQRMNPEKVFSLEASTETLKFI